jgi:hypothetical protein
MTTYNITATGTDSTTNSVVVSTTANMVAGLPIQFSGTTFGGIVAGDTYYIGQILSGTQITLSGTAGGSLVALTTATGVMSATFTSGGQLIIDTIPPGESLESAFTKVNVNFDQIFAAGPVGSNVQIANNTIRTLDTNGNLILAPNGIGLVQSNVSIVPNTANIRNLGSPVRRWNTVYTQYLDVSANLNISGNVAANYFIGNGSQLTGINANSNSIFNGTSNVSITTANANVTVSVDGLSNVAVFGPGSLLVNGWIGNPRVVANDIIIPPGVNASMLGPLVIGNSITGFIPDDSAFYVLGHDPDNI